MKSNIETQIKFFCDKDQKHAEWIYDQGKTRGGIEAIRWIQGHIQRQLDADRVVTPTDFMNAIRVLLNELNQHVNEQLEKLEVE